MRVVRAHDVQLDCCHVLSLDRHICFDLRRCYCSRSNFRDSDMTSWRPMQSWSRPSGWADGSHRRILRHAHHRGVGTLAEITRRRTGWGPVRSVVRSERDCSSPQSQSEHQRPGRRGHRAHEMTGARAIPGLRVDEPPRSDPQRNTALPRWLRSNAGDTSLYRRFATSTGVADSACAARQNVRYR